MLPPRLPATVMDADAFGANRRRIRLHPRDGVASSLSRGSIV